MGTATLQYFLHPRYWEKETIQVESANEALQAVEQLARSLYRNIDTPIMLFFTDTRGEKFGFGVGGEMSTVVLIRNSDEFLYSVGDFRREGYVGYLCPAWTEFSAKQLISHDQAKSALRAWFAGQEVTSVVPLTDDFL